MHLKNVEAAEAYFISEDWHSIRKPGIAAMLRVKDEEEFIKPCLVSIKDFFDEIVIALNCCTDNTPKIIAELNLPQVRVLEYPFTDFKDRFELAVKSRKNALANGGFDQIYSLNDEDLLNKVVQKLTISKPVDYTFRLDNPQLYKKINLAQSSIPTLIRANRSTQSAKPGSATVAVAINGVIRGVSKVQSIDTVEFDFQVMVAPESFQDGVNSIHFYQVNSNASTTDLSPILFESKSDVELINADNNSLFLSINSQRIPVVSNGDHGELTLVAEDDTRHVRAGQLTQLMVGLRRKFSFSLV